jgi:hypothetical protein
MADPVAEKGVYLDLNTGEVVHVYLHLNTGEVVPTQPADSIQLVAPGRTVDAAAQAYIDRAKADWDTNQASMFRTRPAGR